MSSAAVFFTDGNTCSAVRPQSSATADSTVLRDVRAAIAATPAQNDTTPRDSVADLPRSLVDVRWVAPTGQTIRVGPNDNLQSALDRAKPGDVIRLASGATYFGNFTLPTKVCGTAPIVVRTDVPDADLPGEGERITPAASPRLAKIATRNNMPALRTTNPTCGWRLFGLEVTVRSDLPPGAIHYVLIALGDGGSVKGGQTQTTAARVPSRIILDRVYVHGTEATNLVPGDTNGWGDVFVRDRLNGTTERVSISSTGAQGNAASGHHGPSITPDGRFVTFSSRAEACRTRTSTCSVHTAAPGASPVRSGPTA